MKQVKCVIMGEGGVGKTTLLSLIQGYDVSPKAKRSPTIGVNVEKVNLTNTQMAIWDFGGQKRFQFMWEDFLRGTGLTLIVTDSSEKNVMETKEILTKYDKKIGSNIIAIANKQDLANRLSPEQVSRILGIPTYGMVAINTENKSKLEEILLKKEH